MTEKIAAAIRLLEEALQVLVSCEEELEIYPPGSHLTSYHAVEKALRSVQRLQNNYHLSLVGRLSPAPPSDARTPTRTAFGDRTGD